MSNARVGNCRDCWLGWVVWRKVVKDKTGLKVDAGVWGPKRAAAVRWDFVLLLFHKTNFEEMVDMNSMQGSGTVVVVDRVGRNS